VKKVSPPEQALTVAQGGSGRRPNRKERRAAMFHGGSGVTTPGASEAVVAPCAKRVESSTTSEAKLSAKTTLPAIVTAAESIESKAARKATKKAVRKLEQSTTVETPVAAKLHKKRRLDAR